MKKMVNDLRGTFGDRDICLLLAGAIAHILAVVCPVSIEAKCVITTAALVFLLVKCGCSYKGTAAILKQKLRFKT